MRNCVQLAAPKSKYIETILSATHGGEAGVAEVFRTLQLRLRDSTWTIVFKSLIVVHLMIREGQPDVTLRHIAESPKRLAISNFTEVQTQGTNIRCYSDYLLERARSYRDTKTDFVRLGSGRLKGLSVEKGLLRQTESVQNQIKALVKCDMLGNQDPDNEITLTAFRLLTMDLLELFKVMNEGTINVLEHYFEMSRPDAERALAIYKTFGKQTDQVVQFLSTARQYEASTRLEVPKLKHAPVTLTSSLEEYLNDPDFEVNRRQYLAQQQAKKSGKPFDASELTSSANKLQSKAVSTAPPAASTGFPATHAAPAAKGPAPDLIDFFESIEQNQQPMAGQSPPQQQQPMGMFPQAQQYQQSAFRPQQTGYNPFLQNQQQTGVFSPPQPQPVQTDFTGAGFGGFGPQPQQQPTGYSFQSPSAIIPQNGMTEFPQQQQQQPHQALPLQPQQTSTNPFRQSMMPTGQPSALNRQSTNPFAKHLNNPPISPPQDVPTVPQPQSQHADLAANSTFFAGSAFPQSPQQPQQIQPQRTGTNPFARNKSTPVGQAAPLTAHVTGTNPFRQSQFVNQQTGQGWQHSNQGTFNGMDMNTMQTTPVFPRPGA